MRSDANRLGHFDMTGRERTIRLVQHAMCALRLLHIAFDFPGVAEITGLQSFKIKLINAFSINDILLWGGTYLSPT